MPEENTLAKHLDQHQVQAGAAPCEIRRKGLVCESALVFGGMTPDVAADHPLAFNAVLL